MEYGHKIKHKGGMSEANPFMKKAFMEKSQSVLANGFSDAEKIFIKAGYCFKPNNTRESKREEPRCV